MAVLNRLKDIRIRRGLSAADVARRASITRQTIYAIEDGSFVPNTAVSLRLARILAVSVEEIFSLEKEEEPVAAEASLLTDAPVNPGALVRLCRVSGRVTAVPASYLPAFLPRADGVANAHSDKAVLVPSEAVPDDGSQLLLAGCDPALSILSEALHGKGIDILTVSCSSRRALEWLKGGEVNVAGSHLLDKQSGEYNVPLIRRLLPEAGVRVVTFAVWETGLVVRPGNPKSLRGVADLANKGVRLINREKGSGSRDLLDSTLRRLGIETAHVAGYDDLARGHLAAAYAVLSGAADCCIAPRSAARCFGLEFVPLAIQRFDLTFSAAALDLPATRPLLDMLNHLELRRKLRNVAGYDSTQTGDLLV